MKGLRKEKKNLNNINPNLEQLKVKLWDELEDLFHNILQGKNVFLEVDLNEHVGSISKGFEGVCGRKGYGLRDVMQRVNSS